MKKNKKEQFKNSSWNFELDQTNLFAFWNEAFSKEECQTIINIAKDKGLIRGTTLQGCSNFTTQKLKFETSCFSSRNNKQKLTLNTKQLFKFNRPLLTFSRTELKNLSKLNCLPYTLDPSNLDIKFTRNRIRLIVFPILKKYVKFNFEKQLLHYNEVEFSLTHREAELLLNLYEHKNKVLDRSLILTKLWGSDDFFNGRSMDVFISKFRKKLNLDSDIKIINIRGSGYKLTF